MKNLRKIRKERNLTQQRLAIETHIEQSLLSKYETGERTPTVENLVILADYFGTNIDFLLD
ncbi:helix-turn-helix domain-containing protein, partial [Oscillospiraceae bacterium OttesenSCG-928-F05]|nr:helix-turn-helix domain-containing protein [Oscillospiraceae bacterium OttesenSCG-928-F05]